MDTGDVMEKRRHAIEKGNRHWRRGAARNSNVSQNIRPRDWRQGMDTSRAPNFAALIPVSGEAFPVDARKLHATMQVGRDYSTWIGERIRTYGFQIGKDFSVLTEHGGNSNGGRPALYHALSLDMAKELAMVERTETGHQVRQYFIECERRLLERPHAALDPNNLPTHLDTARALVVALEDRDRLRRDLESQRPQVEFAQAVSDSVNCVDLATAAQRLQCGHYRLMARLRDLGILIAGGPRRNLPMQRYLDRGYFVVVTGTHERMGEVHTHSSARVTGKGLEWLHSILNAGVQQQRLQT